MNRIYLLQNNLQTTHQQKRGSFPDLVMRVISVMPARMKTAPPIRLQRLPIRGRERIWIAFVNCLPKIG